MKMNNNEETVFKKLLRFSLFANLIVTFGIFVICLIASWALTFAFQQVNVWVGTLALFGVWMTWSNIKSSSLYVALVKYIEIMDEED